jgi:hypothetical protein
LSQRDVETFGVNPHHMMPSAQRFGRMPYQVTERRRQLGQGDVCTAQGDPSVCGEAMV